jgi:hypothetical protein
MRLLDTGLRRYDENHVVTPAQAGVQCGEI